ncbi:MAG TPA: serine protease [Stackebrandtia sp.]|uniref:serine protease n=1 Tax=Stackebrandtia sp. TaxID=2023065 RepID=UPI002D67FD52|nr:serine protease [Stackebrandtia sp.]HZE39020.1 serine protease [Stackebrandtia sp.]
MKLKTKRLAILGAAAVAAGALAVGYASLPAQADDSHSGKGVHEKVVGGEPAKDGEFPFIVRMFSDGSELCDGSIIRQDVILTAAHCAAAVNNKPDGVTFKYGANKVSQLTKEVKATDIKVSANWDDNSMKDDWAVFKIDTPITDVEPVTLAADDSNDKGDQTIMGWGSTSEGGDQSDDLMKATVPVVDDETCKKAYDTLDAASMLCAGKDEGGVDTCQGDSGGPMGVVGDDGKFTQTGIVSWGQGCAEKGFPGVYGQVSYLAKDINAAADGFGGGQ